MEKLVIIINGKGGVGKDTLCDLAAKHFKTENVSAITPIKDIASANGWDGGKDDKSRKFLSDLKNAFIEYNDLPTKYLYKKYERFLCVPGLEIMFVHIRESSEIDKFKKLVTKCPCATLLITNDNDKVYGNKSDDDVCNYDYDLYYNNTKSLEEAEIEFTTLLKEYINMKCK